MSEYRCPECDNETSFQGYFSVLLDIDGDGIFDADSFDASNVDFDSSYTMICAECGYTDPAAYFEPDRR